MSRSIFAWSVFALNTVFCALTVFILIPVARWTSFGDHVQRFWARSIFWLSGVRIRSSSAQEMPGPGPYIVMCNHESHLDPPLLIHKLPLSLRFVAKIELLYIPIFGQGMWAVGHIPIDRSNRNRAIDSLRRAGERIRSGVSVLVFPEGTRNPNPDGPLLAFKKGGFMLAIEAGVPILPVAVAGTSSVLPKGRMKITPAPATFHIGDPIPTAGKGKEDRDALMAEVREAISTLRESARREIGLDDAA